MLRLYYLFIATSGLILTFVRAAWHFRQRATGALDLPETLVMGTKEKRRLKHYFYGTTYLAALMCCLRGQARSDAEKHLFSNLSALSYSFDDLVDAFREGGDPSVLWQDNPEAYGLAVDERGLALHLLRNIYRELPPAALTPFRTYMHRVFNVETAGRQQAVDLAIQGLGDSGIQELEKITAEKGGCSALLFRSVLSHALSAEEERAVYQFGYLIQFCDDIFDLWQDRQAGTVTLATVFAERGRVEVLTHLFEQQVAATHQAFRQTPYPPGQVETTLYAMHYLISITRVCLRHYQDLERKYGTLPLQNRTLIVVDMEFWTNRFRAVRYLLRPLQ